MTKPEPLKGIVKVNIIDTYYPDDYYGYGKYSNPTLLDEFIGDNSDKMNNDWTADDLYEELRFGDALIINDSKTKWGLKTIIQGSLEEVMNDWVMGKESDSWGWEGSLLHDISDRGHNLHSDDYDGPKSRRTSWGAKQVSRINEARKRR